MPKPLLIDRPKVLCLALPESLYAKVSLHLYSELEGKVPQGAWKQFFVDRIEEYFNRLEKKE